MDEKTKEALAITKTVRDACSLSDPLRGALSHLIEHVTTTDARLELAEGIINLARAYFEEKK